jgi:RNA-dependent RNA polymerase
VFCDKDHIAYCWDHDVNVEWFLQWHVGGVLWGSLNVTGHSFQFLAYSTSSLHEYTVWFVSPFHDPVEGFVNAESIYAQLGYFSKLLHMSTKYTARIAQAFTSIDPSVKLHCG